MEATSRQLQTNINEIKQTIENNKTDHLNDDIQVLAVTKTVEPAMMRQLFNLGLHRFGENRVNTLLEKQEALGDIKDDIEWHFIGRLQTRPVKKMINKIDYLHSLDRLSLATEIQKRADHPIKCYLQVNVSGEASKAGIQPDELDGVIQTLADFDKIIIVGLMTMAPLDASDDELHQEFSHLRFLQEKIESQAIPYAPSHGLSMGMSRDYGIATSEGATIVRIGSALYQSISLD